MTFCLEAASLAAPHRVEEYVPVIIFTPSRVMRRLASLAAAVGSVASPTTKTSLLPMTPPCALMRSRMASEPSMWRLPLAPGNESEREEGQSYERDKGRENDMATAHESSSSGRGLRAGDRTV